MKATLQSETAVLNNVIVRRAVEAFRGDAFLEEQWQPLGFLARPDFRRSEAESDAFVSLLRRLGVDVLTLPYDAGLTIDSIYTRDCGMVCDKGLILCQMGKPNRSREPAALAKAARCRFTLHSRPIWHWCIRI